MENILGLSIGTKLMGIAVRYQGELSEYRIRTFYGKWSEGKEERILARIHRIIIRNDIQVLSLKAPDRAHSSPNLLHLLKRIEQLAARLEVRLMLSNISDLKARFGLRGQVSKDLLAKAILDRHQWDKELGRIYARMHRRDNSYYHKLFEAIACTELT